MLFDLFDDQGRNQGGIIRDSHEEAVVGMLKLMGTKKWPAGYTLVPRKPKEEA